MTTLTGTCIERDCDNPVFIKKRQLCRKHYARAHYAGEIGTRRRHAVTAMEGAKTGFCQLCGPEVPIRWRSRGLAECQMGLRETKRCHKYRLEHNVFMAMLDECNWCCEICDRPIDQITAHVDHDHACCSGEKGKRTCGRCVRGLLCRFCNVGIGMLKDDPAVALAAALYLEARKLDPSR